MKKTSFWRFVVSISMTALLNSVTYGDALTANPDLNMQGPGLNASIGGVGLHDVRSGSISVTINGPVLKAILYWNGAGPTLGPQELLFDGVLVQGVLAGSEVENEVPQSYRADVTAIVQGPAAGVGLNIFTVEDPSPIDNLDRMHGAGLLVIWQDLADPTTYQFIGFDGGDFAWRGFLPGENGVTTPISLGYAASANPRTADLLIMAGGAQNGRPDRIDVSDNASINDALNSSSGSEFDADMFAISIPALAISTMVELVSPDELPNADSMLWTLGAMRLAVETPEPQGACCQTDGSCSELIAADCATAGGAYQGDGTACATASCPQPPPLVGACCLEDGTCIEVPLQPASSGGGTAGVCDIHPGCGGGGLVSFGQFNEHGYPAWYEDKNGLRLSHVFDVNDPFFGGSLPPPTIPGTPLDVDAGNFFEESFYFLSTSTIPTQGGQGSALLVMALEGTFGGPIEEILQGDQTVFSRIRIRLDIINDPANAGVYRIIYPYGCIDFLVTNTGGTDGNGRRVINFTDDCLHVLVNGVITPTCAPGSGLSFSTPLDSAVSPLSHYLFWDPAVLPAAPVGYVGNLFVQHPVLGSPCGQNFFRVEGPNIGGPGIDFIETNLFDTGGKIADAKGACCLTDNSCALGTAADCAKAGGAYQGDATACGSVVCGKPAPTGACCLSDVSCTEGTAADCNASGGAYQGDGSACATTICPQGPAAACVAAGGVYQGDNTACATTNCPQPPAIGACCHADGTCNDGLADDCAAAGGDYQGVGIACAAIKCPQPSSCPADCALPSDGTVGVADLLQLLSEWGNAKALCDVDGDGNAGISDLLAILSAFGPCP